MPSGHLPTRITFTLMLSQHVFRLHIPPQSDTTKKHKFYRVLKLREKARQRNRKQRTDGSICPHFLFCFCFGWAFIFRFSSRFFFFQLRPSSFCGLCLHEGTENVATNDHGITAIRSHLTLQSLRQASDLCLRVVVTLCLNALHSLDVVLG